MSSSALGVDVFPLLSGQGALANWVTSQDNAAGTSHVRALSGDGAGAGATLVLSGTVAGVLDNGDILTLETRYQAIDAHIYTPGGAVVGVAIPVARGYPAALAQGLALADGGFLVSWADQTSGFSFVAQFYDASGNPVGHVLPLDQNYSGMTPALAQATNGDILCAVASGRSLTVTRYATDGTTLGSTAIDTGQDAGYPVEHRLIALSNGGFAALWVEHVTSQINGPQHVQFFDADGQATSPELTYDSWGEARADATAIAQLANGNIVVAWSENLAGNFTSSLISLRIYAPDGAPVGEKQTIDIGQFWTASSPAIVAQADGSFILAMTDGTSTDAGAVSAVFAVRFDPATGRVLSGGSVACLTGTGRDDLFTHLTDGITVNGKGGLDTASYADAAQGVTVSLTVKGAQDTHGAGHQTLQSIENLIGSAHDDVLRGNAGGNRVDGGAGNDRLYGGAGADHLIGGAGDDRLYGGSGRNEMEGGTGNDTYIVTAPGQTIVEHAGEGFDTIVTTISMALPTNVEKLVLAKGAGNLTANDNAGDNVLIGNEGDNTLFALNGGHDRLTGGGGADTFVLTMPKSSADRVVITDFTSGTDSIDLRFAALSGVNHGNLATGDLGYSAHALSADDHLFYDQPTGHLFYDVDGDGPTPQVLLVTLAGGSVLVASDLIV